MREKDWIFFDFDGTLFDTKEGVAKCGQYALRAFGIEEPDWEAMDFFVGPPLEYTFSTRYGFTEEQCVRAVDIYRERYNSTGVFECRPYPGIRETLTSLREKGYKVGVASSKPERLCKQILKNHQLSDCFDDVCGADEATGRSVKKDVLLEALRRMGERGDASRAVLIGDTVFDVEGAASVSMDCVAVSYGFGDVEEMRLAGALAVLSSMEEIDAFFEAKV